MFHWLPVANTTTLDACRNSQQGYSTVVDELGERILSPSSFHTLSLPRSLRLPVHLAQPPPVWLLLSSELEEVRVLFLSHQWLLHPL